MNQPSRLAALVLAVGVIALGALAPTSATADAPGSVHAAASAAVSVSLTVANSGDLASGEPLKAVVTIDNPTTATTNVASATLSLDPKPFSSRDALADWFAGKTKASAASQTIAKAPVPPVASEASDGVNVSVPAATLDLSTAGVYAVAVTVSSGSTVVGTSRSAIALGASSAPTVPVAIAVPITVPAGDSEFLTAAQLTQYTAADGILTKELDDVEGTDVAIGVDPRILASIRILGKTAPATATSWLDSLKALPNESFPLAWADADITAPLHVGANAVLVPKSLDYAIDPSLFPTTTNSTPTPAPTSGGSSSTVPTSAQLVAWKYTMPALQWPTANSVEPSDLAKLASAGITSAILTTHNVDDASAHGLAGASAKSGTTTLAISDDTLSEYFRAAAESSNRSGSQRPMTELATTLALIGFESGSSPRPLLITLDPNWASNDQTFARSIGDLYDRTWVTSAELSSVFSASPTKVTLDRDSESSSRLALVSDMLTAESRVVQFSPIAKAPDAITSSYRLQLLSMLSNEWLATPAAWVTAARAFITQADKVVSSVQISKSSTLLLLSDQTALPISISNGLDQDVTVTLSVRPSTPLVSIDRKDKVQTVTISANSQRRVEGPLQALSNGKAQLLVTLTSVTGQQVGEAVTLKVNVQAGWETLGTLIFVALVVALFAFGVIRNIRKRRREANGGAS